MWTKKEHEIVEKLFANTPTHEIARRIGRPEKSVQQIANRKGLTKSREHLSRMRSRARAAKKDAWTPEEVEFLREHAGKKQGAWIAERIGKTTAAVLGKKSRLGL